MPDQSDPILLSVHRLTEPDWFELTRSFLDYSYQQTWAYGHAMARLRQACCEFVAVRDTQRIVGLAAVRIRRIPILGGGIAYVSGGPMTRREGTAFDVTSYVQCLHALRDHYGRGEDLIVRALAPLGPPAWNEDIARACEAAGVACTDEGRRYRTLRVDLRGGLDELHAACSKYWRRNLRRGERSGLTVRAGTAPEMFEAIVDLYGTLRARKNFRSDLDACFYADLQQWLPVDDALVASLALADGVPVAGLVCSMLGDTAVPLVLAATEDGLRHYANYLLQWCSIVMARERGLQAYDLGGVDPEGNPGVFNFKKGLGGAEAWAAGPFEVAPVSLRCVVARGAERLYRRIAA